jgi:hypothetical protein
VSKHYCAKKRRYDNHPLASREWFIKKLKEEHNLLNKPRVPLYQLEKERAIAYLDYKWLGLKVEGAPDGTDEEVLKYLFRDNTRSYLTRIYYRLHWFDIQLETLSDN